MVYDYISHEEYKLDLEELVDVIRNNALLICHSKKEISFFDDWIKLLYRAYNEDSSRFSLENIDNSQIFQKEIFLGTQKVLLHFQVDVLDDLLKKHGNRQNYYITELLDKGLMYTHEDENFRTQLEKPIFIVPLPLGFYNAFVVDGNHRLSYKVAHGEKKIAAYNISPYLAVISLTSKFEQYIYGIIMDSFTVRNNSSDVIFKLPINFYKYFEGQG